MVLVSRVRGFWPFHLLFFSKLKFPYKSCDKLNYNGFRNATFALVAQYLKARDAIAEIELPDDVVDVEGLNLPPRMLYFVRGDREFPLVLPALVHIYTCDRCGVYILGPGPMVVQHYHSCGVKDSTKTASPVYDPCYPLQVTPGTAKRGGEEGVRGLKKQKIAEAEAKVDYSDDDDYVLADLRRKKSSVVLHAPLYIRRVRPQCSEMGDIDDSTVKTIDSLKNGVLTQVEESEPSEVDELAEKVAEGQKRERQVSIFLSLKCEASSHSVF